MSDLKTLTRQAVIGAERSTLSRTEYSEFLQAQLASLPAANPAADILQTAGFLWLTEQVNYQPDTLDYDINIPEGYQFDLYEICSDEEMAVGLQIIRKENYAVFFREWANHLIALSRFVPSEHIAPLLAYGRQKVTYQPWIAKIIPDDAIWIIQNVHSLSSRWIVKAREKPLPLPDDIDYLEACLQTPSHQFLRDARFQSGVFMEGFLWPENLWQRLYVRITQELQHFEANVNTIPSLTFTLSYLLVHCPNKMLSPFWEYILRAPFNHIHDWKTFLASHYGIVQFRYKLVDILYLSEDL